MFAKREPVWDEITLNLRKGDTTFISCGWCEYRSGGSYRYDCMLEGGCELSKTNYNTKYFDSSCDIVLLGRRNIQSNVERKEREIKDNEEQIKRIRQQINTLKELKLVDNMPYLPDNRQYDYFNLGDEVMVFIQEDNDFTPLITGWSGGKVVPGYRHHDGCVSVYVYEKYHIGNFLNGHGYSVGVATPVVMLKEEYEWFVGNPLRFTDWIKLACQDNRFNPNITSWEDIDIPTAIE